MALSIESIVALTLLLCVFFFTLGRWYDAAKKSEAQSQVAFYAALWAATEARALHRSTVIQRIIEKTQVMKPPADEVPQAVKDMNDELEAAIQGVEKKVQARVNGSANIDLEDLV